jgi:Cu-Zn family superoxide dismutase
MTLKKHAKKTAALLAALAATGVLAACGSSDGTSTSDTTTVSGQFEPVADAPAAYAEVAGEATLERPDGGTEASISLTGLQPGTGYEAHLHTGGCDEADPGGPHFQFDPHGSEEPPNEIHFSFSASEAGEGEAKASSDREVPVGEAGSIVVHLADEAMKTHNGEHHEGEDDHGGAHQASDKVACADLEAGSASATSAEATIMVANGEPVGGIQELEYDAGDRIAFRVESDVADEIHVHGYDLMQEVPAGGFVTFDFPAEIEGIFEVELEGRKEQIAEIRVNP